MEKLIYSLGCSFMSTDSRYQDRPSFLDQYAAVRGWQHVCLARPGATNFSIRLQIQRAIEDGADYVVVGATSSDRIDVTKVDFIRRLPIQLEHIQYTGYHATSEAHVDNQFAYIVSDTLNNVVENTYSGLDADCVDSVKHYIRDLHNPDLADLRDRWVIRDGLRELAKAKIPFLFIPGPLFYFDWSEFPVWTGPQPWDMPHGIDELSINHNYPATHEMFCQALINQTQEWI
jgi:hypothetical protein